MKVCGIDPSLSRTAIATGAGGEPIVAVCGSKPAPGLYARFERYKLLALETVKHTMGAHLILIEGYSFGSKGSSTVTLGEYGGLLRQLLLRNAIEVVEVAPSSLKKFVCGKGNAGKSEFVSAATKRWDFQFKGEDEFFAAALYRLGLCYAKMAATETRAQEEVVKLLRSCGV